MRLTTLLRQADPLPDPEPGLSARGRAELRALVGVDPAPLEAPRSRWQVGAALVAAGTTVAALVVTVVVLNQGGVLPAVPAQRPTSVPTSPVSDPADERNIVMTLNSEASLKFVFDRIAELAESDHTEAVILGKVIETEDLWVEQQAYRVLTVAVASSRKSVVAGTVTIYEDGGVVPYAKVLPLLQEHAEEELPQAGPNDYVDLRFMGASHTETGDEIVAFVLGNPNSPELIPADYQLVSGPQALLVRDSATGSYQRRGIEVKAQPNAETSITPAELESVLATLPRPTPSPAPTER